MAKEINEKTFELNITNELLNLSKSFNWYLSKSPLSNLLPERVWLDFLNQSTFFATGLTQKEENKNGGGYDISIDINNSSLKDKRLMMLQFKSGVNKKYHIKYEQSYFHKNKNPTNNPHIEFTLNESIDNSQHIILRELANSSGIQNESVMYVFPRITKYNDFTSKIGNLIINTSFVPVLEIDNQAALNKPPLEIKKGSIHKFRTSYDGKFSEVNLLLLLLLLDNDITSKLLSELISIQIERFIKLLFNNDKTISSDIVQEIKNEINKFANQNLSDFNQNIIILQIENYLSKLLNHYKKERKIIFAPNNFTNILNDKKFLIRTKSECDFSSVSYQIF